MNEDLKLIEAALELGEQAWHFTQREPFEKAFSALDRLERRVKELEKQDRQRPDSVDRAIELEQSLREVLMVAVWLSAANDYQPNGMAELGWNERRPILERAREILNKERK